MDIHNYHDKVGRVSLSSLRDNVTRQFIAIPVGLRYFTAFNNLTRPTLLPFFALLQLINKKPRRWSVWVCIPTLEHWNEATRVEEQLRIDAILEKVLQDRVNVEEEMGES